MGTQVVPCLAMFDTMKHIGSDVATVGFGACMGMSGFLMSVGKKVCSGALLIFKTLKPRALLRLDGYERLPHDRLQGGAMQGLQCASNPVIGRLLEPCDACMGLSGEKVRPLPPALCPDP